MKTCSLHMILDAVISNDTRTKSRYADVMRWHAFTTLAQAGGACGVERDGSDKIRKLFSRCSSHASLPKRKEHEARVESTNRLAKPF
jgi:hypothetical protein